MAMLITVRSHGSKTSGMRDDRFTRKTLVNNKEVNCVAWRQVSHGCGTAHEGREARSEAAEQASD